MKYILTQFTQGANYKVIFIILSVVKLVVLTTTLLVTLTNANSKNVSPHAIYC